MAKQGTKHSINAQVLIKKNKGADEKSDFFSIGSVEELVNPARVNYRRSETFNLGNYESRRIEAELSIPCEMNKQSVDAAWDAAEEWVNERIKLTADRLDKEGA